MKKAGTPLPFLFLFVVIFSVLFQLINHIYLVTNHKRRVLVAI
ncbi:hypothetical protein DR996_20740 [Vibrio owensii]|nr:hypothetical protein DR996_11840 [Vibrio owensii]QLK47521.1 hypothetical protein DR996_20740 [Vibrio owensii]